VCKTHKVSLRFAEQPACKINYSTMKRQSAHKRWKTGQKRYAREMYELAWLCVKTRHTPTWLEISVK